MKKLRIHANIRMQIEAMSDERLMKSIEYHKQQLSLMFDMNDIDNDLEAAHRSMLSQLNIEKERRDKFNKKIKRAGQTNEYKKNIESGQS